MKRHTLPAKYRNGFLRDIDKRTELYGYLRAAYDELMSDMGGSESLSHARRCLAERFVFLEFTLHAIEKDIADDVSSENAMDLFGRWVQGLNSLTGLARTIGMDRRAKPVINLKQYVRSARQQEREHREAVNE